MKFNQNQKELRKRLLEVIHTAKASHIGSCIGVIDIIDSIYQIKKNNDKFVLSNGHAAAALYVVLEKNKLLSNIDLNELGVHPTRSEKNHIDVSTGSLGQGLPIALGMAMANNKKQVFCLVSDGEMAEGSMWEALRVYQSKFPKNLRIIVSANGWGAYDPISQRDLKKRISGFGIHTIVVNGHDGQKLNTILKSKLEKPTVIFAKTKSDQLSFLNDLGAHYHTMSEDDYKSALKVLK